jgi:hypothetical protein
MVAACVAGTSVHAQSEHNGQQLAEARDMRSAAHAITLSRVPTLQIVRPWATSDASGGGWRVLEAPPAFGTRGGCEAIATHTNANFEGGEYLVQAGFSDGESLAATYTLPANAFPIVIRSAEQIFATSGTIVQTTTQWGIQFYSGNPRTGQLLFSENSDGDVLPNIVLAPGTNGTNVLFAIDGSDPEQIIIPNDGSNQFSVVWRVVRHNSPSTNPCLVAPASNRNAFPVTDNTGVASLAGNSLFGLNCGPLGCPANGGWSTFQGLAAGLCRPSGDWVTRVTWESVTCPTASGACCLGNGTCISATSQACASQGGTYQGDNTSCSAITCPQATGACCFGTGVCIQTVAAQCIAGGGTFLGVNIACAPNNTCPTGACCLPTGECVGSVTAAQCAAQSGTFRGVGTTCVNANCPPPTGACCVNNGAACFVLTQAVCAGIPGSSWQGALTTCADANNDGQADACATGNVCGDIDFNNDDLFPADEDLVDYLVVLAGGACSTGNCDTIDFNGDGLFPSDDDLLTLLCELAGGECCQ